MTPSDLLVWLMALTHCAITAATPENARKRRVTYKGRDAQKRRRYAPHGPGEFRAELTA